MLFDRLRRPSSYQAPGGPRYFCVSVFWFRPEKPKQRTSDNLTQNNSYHLADHINTDGPIHTAFADMLVHINTMTGN